MATTAQQIIDLARLPLVDADKTRFADADALKYLNFGIRLLRGKRPDLFIGSLKDDLTDLTLTSEVTLPQMTHQALADYVTARCETHDDEEAMNDRAQQFFALAAGEL